MRRPLVLIALVAAAACTGHSPTPTSSSPTSTSPSPAESPARPDLTLEVVATTSGSEADEDRTYLDGMQFAVDELNASGGVRGQSVGLEIHDDQGSVGTATDTMKALLDEDPTAVLYVGPGRALTPLRADFDRTETPVVLLGGDLYMSRGLFPEVYQTTIPWEWQAHVIARYIVLDRKANDVVFLGTGPDAPLASEKLAAALDYWGGRLAASFTDKDRDARSGFAKGFERAAKADWAVVYGLPVAALGLANGIEEAGAIDRAAHPKARPGITGPASLIVPGGGLANPEPGTTACYTYTWAGWAEPIKRVGGFRAAFTAATGREPDGLEQEGYDAVRVVARALAKSKGSGGSKLLAVLEATGDYMPSGYPIDFGPDDHMFLPRDELGLFAVAGPKERVDPWQEAGSQPWRPVMRTFTYDGTRTNVLDRDKKVFFPFWGKDQPGPEFWRSRYGIASRSADPLH